MLTRRTVIRAGLEAVAGTDPAIASFTELLAWDVEIDIRAEMLERSIMRDTLSPMAPALGMKDVGVSFKTEIKSGDPGSVPEMDILLDGCGFGTAAQSGTGPFIYSLKSADANLKSASLLVYKDGNMHKVTGARGTVRFVMETGQFGVAEWDFQGMYNAVVAITIPDLSGVNLEEPPIIYSASFNIGGFNPVTNSLVIDLGNQIVRRGDLHATYGVKEYRITGRTPKMEFNADAVVESSNPFWGDWQGTVINTFAILIGTSIGHGHEVQFQGHYQLDTNKYGDADGVSQYECVASLISSTANSKDDEFTITFGKAAVA